MEVNGQPIFTFTPGQREEALAWVKKECPQLYTHIEEALTGHEADMLIDMYFKLKSLIFELRPDEFIVGVEYKSQQDVTDGKEAIAIRFQNPRRDKTPHDQFALQIMMELLHRLKG